MRNVWLTCVHVGLRRDTFGFWSARDNLQRDERGNRSAMDKLYRFQCGFRCVPAQADNAQPREWSALVLPHHVRLATCFARASTYRAAVRLYCAAKNSTVRRFYSALRRCCSTVRWFNFTVRRFGTTVRRERTVGTGITPPCGDLDTVCGEMISPCATCAQCSLGWAWRAQLAHGPRKLRRVSPSQCTACANSARCAPIAADRALTAQTLRKLRTVFPSWCTVELNQRTVRSNQRKACADSADNKNGGSRRGKTSAGYCFASA